jgi:hypothetical protein
VSFHETSALCAQPASEQVRTPLNRSGQNQWTPFALFLGPLKIRAWRRSRIRHGSQTMTDRSNDALIALRQIQRRTEHASKRLAAIAGLTPSQLLVMQILSERGETSAAKSRNCTQLKTCHHYQPGRQALFARGLIERRRCEKIAGVSGFGCKCRARTPLRLHLTCCRIRFKRASRPCRTGTSPCWFPP